MSNAQVKELIARLRALPAYRAVGGVQVVNVLKRDLDEVLALLERKCK